MRLLAFIAACGGSVCMAGMVAFWVAFAAMVWRIDGERLMLIPVAVMALACSVGCVALAIMARQIFHGDI